MKFYEKLQQLRREQGLSQEMLAEKLDVSRQAVSKWESGQTYPETDKLIMLSDIFGTTLDSLVKDGELNSREDRYMGREMIYPYFFFRSYEYKSRRALFGLPLVHVNVGPGRSANGVVAIGLVSRGIVSVGLLSAGIVSVGVLSAGLISLGVVSLGAGLAVGAVSVGVFSLGAVAIGVFSTGALAVASHIAVGDHAYGHIAVGRVAQGVRVFIDTSVARNFSYISAYEVRQAINEEFPRLWNWIARLMTSFFRS